MRFTEAKILDSGIDSPYVATAPRQHRVIYSDAAPKLSLKPHTACTTSVNPVKVRDRYISSYELRRLLFAIICWLGICPVASLASAAGGLEPKDLGNEAGG